MRHERARMTNKSPQPGLNQTPCDYMRLVDLQATKMPMTLILTLMPTLRLTPDQSLSISLCHFTYFYRLELNRLLGGTVCKRNAHSATSQLQQTYLNLTIMRFVRLRGQWGCFCHLFGLCKHPVIIHAPSLCSLRLCCCS